MAALVFAFLAVRGPRGKPALAPWEAPGPADSTSFGADPELAPTADADTA